MSDLVRAVHDALNATAVPRTPEPTSLPPLGTGCSLALPRGSGVGPGAGPGVGLEEVVAARRSAYRFGPGQPTLPQLAGVLLRGVGSAPRAGGLASVVAHLVVSAPGPVALGVHRADLRLPLPALHQVRAGDPTAYVAASLDQPPFATRAPTWLALTLDTTAATGRYPPRHYRTLHLDAGVALQNVLLLATALGLAACPVMGYDDRAWARLLDLPESMLVGVLVALGPAPR